MVLHRPVEVAALTKHVVDSSDRRRKVMLNDMAHWSIITSVNSATPAILVLTLVGVALVYAALYALFAKPSTSQGKKRRNHLDPLPAAERDAG